MWPFLCQVARLQWPSSHLFESVPIPNCTHLEQYTRDGDYVLIRRRNVALPEDYAATPPEDGYTMHPFSPLLRKFGFKGGFEGANCLVYLPAYKVACWGISTHDANALAHDFENLLTDAALAHDYEKSLTDAVGGAWDQFAEELLREIPLFLWVYTDIQCLAACSILLRDLVYQKNYWSDKHIRLDVPELCRDGARARRALHRFRQARTITLDIPQLAWAERVPHHCLATWRAHQLRLPGDEVQGWESSHPLFGAARYSLTLPSNARTVYFGVKSVASDQRAYVMVENPHDTDSEIYAGLTGSSPVRLPDSKAHKLLMPPGTPNVVLLRWNARSMQLDVNGKLLCRAWLHAEAENAPAPFSFIFVWIFLRQERTQQRPVLLPMLTPVASDVQPRPILV